MKSFCRIVSLKVLLLLLPVFLLINQAQAQTPVFADPALNSFDITNLSDVPVTDAEKLTLGSIYRIKLVVLNLDQLDAIPDGTAYITIGLGSKFIIDPAFNLSAAVFNNYFTWSSQTSGGQTTIYGIIHTPLPANFIGELSFNVQANILGSSTVSGNFLVSNNNPLYTLSDDNSGNNFASIHYTIIPPVSLPVTITGFSATNRGCSINVNWSSQQELNLAKYEVEASRDGINFTKVAEVPAQNRSNYNTAFDITDNIKGPVMLLRLKSVDLDGNLKYSNVVSVPGTCNGKTLGIVYGFPNPLTGAEYITISAREGSFNGTYRITLSDISGKVYSAKETLLTNVTSFRYELGTVKAAGKYIISIRKTDGSENAVVQFEKL